MKFLFSVILILTVFYCHQFSFGKYSEDLQINSDSTESEVNRNNIDSSEIVNPDSDTSQTLIATLPEIRIGKILLVGNDVTDDDIITREISIRENTILDLKQLEEDIGNLYKLGLFNKIDVLPVPTDSLNKFDLMIMVEEKFYILPIPQGGFRDGQFTKFWAGMNLIWYNFRGRNETLNLNFGIGYEPFISLNYTVPWIGENSHYFSSGSVSYSKNYNRSLLTLNDTTSNTIPSSDDNYLNYNFSASYKFGKYFSKYFSVSTNLKYNSVESDPYQPGRTISTDGIDRFMTFGIFGRYDARDSYEYTLDGSYYSLEYEKVGFGKTIDFNRVNFEAKNFLPIEMNVGKYITFANRTFGSISFGGTIPSYQKEYFGYNNIIRGYKKLVFEGENKLGIFNEFRIPVINPDFIKGRDLPLVKSISALKNLNYKFGLYATIFYDVGGIWYKDDNFFDTQFYSGYGVGLNFILPFGFVGRTDFCLRQQNNELYTTVLFDLDASF
ncbi:MAG: POTRA domain-containing protein [Ignavibacteria bacterium]